MSQSLALGWDTRFIVPVSVGTSMSADRHSLTTRRPPLWLIFAITATGVMANTMVGPSIPDILDHFGRSDSDAGIFVAAGPAPAILLAPVFGVLADRRGRRAVLLPSLVAFAVGGTIAMVATSWWMLIVARFVQGIGTASLIGLAVSLIADNWEGPDRIRYISWNSAVLTVGVAAFPPLGGLLASLGTWRWSFSLFPIGFATALLVAWKLNIPVQTRNVPVRQQLLRASIAVREPRFKAAIAVGFVVFMMIFGLFLTVFPVMLLDKFELAAGGRGLVIGVPAVTSTIAALLLSRTRMRFGARRLIGVGAVVLGAAYAMIGIADTVVVVIIGSLVYGLAEGTLIPTLQEIVSSSADTDSRAAVVSVFTSVMRSGQTAGPLLASLLITDLGPQTLFLLGATMLVGVGLAVMATSVLDVA
ncbi:MAG: MFS transporter [Actinobacteria bacterium]|nr:MFS transporter [Actinomycetota bacterium]